MIRFYFFCLAWSIGLGTSLPVRGQAWQWATAQSSGSAGPVQFTAMAVDGAGNTVVGGSFSGTVTLGSFTLTSAGSTDGVVARLSPAGMWLQAVRVGGAGSDGVTALAISSTGILWVTGGFSNSLPLGGTTLTSTTYSSASPYNGLFLASLTSGGQWQNAAQATNVVSGILLPEANGDVLLVGYYYDANVTFGTVVLPKPVIRDNFVVRYRPGTGWLHVAYASINSYLNIDGAALDAAGNLVLAGAMSIPAGTTVRFGSLMAIVPPASGTYTGYGGYSSVYVARFSPTGVWTQLVCTSPGTGYGGVALALDATGDALVAGSLTDFRGTFGSLTLQNPVPTGNVPLPYLARLSAAGTWTQVQGGVGPGGIANLHLDGSYARLYGTSAGFTLTNTSATGVQTTRTLSVSSPYGLTPTTYLLSPTGRLVAAGTFYYPSATFGSFTLTTSDQQTAFVASAAGLVLTTPAARQPGSLALFPNPTRTRATLRLSAPAAEPLPILLTDMLGCSLSQQMLPAQAMEAVLDCTHLPPGLYLVRVGTATSKLIVE